MMSLHVMDVGQGVMEAIVASGGKVTGKKGDSLIVFPEGTRYSGEQYIARQVSAYMEEHYPDFAAKFPPLTAEVHRFMLPNNGDILSYAEGYTPPNYDFGQPNAVSSPCLTFHETVEARKFFISKGFHTWKDLWFPK